jgi:hypothetical protein
LTDAVPPRQHADEVGVGAALDQGAALRVAGRRGGLDRVAPGLEAVLGVDLLHDLGVRLALEAALPLLQVHEAGRVQPGQLEA